MGISLSTVEQIEEVGADPGTIANSGFLYTKDVAGVTQLFYEADDGTVSQITPASPSVPSGWTDGGTFVRLTTANDNVTVGGTVDPGPKKLLVLGTLAGTGIRSESGTAGATLFDVLKTGEAGAQLAISLGAGAGDSGKVAFGDGTGAPDTNVFRASVVTPGPITVTALVTDKGMQFGGDLYRNQAAWIITTLREITDGAGDAITLRASSGRSSAGVGNVGGVATLKAGNGSAGTTSGAGGAAVVQAGDSASSGPVVNGGDVHLVAGAGAGAGVSGSVIVRDSGGGAADVLPATTGTGQVGKASQKWALVRATTITSGDIAFDDPGCPNCGQEFAKGDRIVLGVHRTDKDEMGTRIAYTVPMHVSCGRRRKAA